MASFNSSDYDLLFSMGQKLYASRSAETRKRVATVLMAMAESVRGQQIGWPNIPPRLRHLSMSYPAQTRSGDIIPFRPKELP
jgi:hypothetical protein